MQKRIRIILILPPNASYAQFNSKRAKMKNTFFHIHGLENIKGFFEKALSPSNDIACMTENH